MAFLCYYALCYGLLGHEVFQVIGLEVHDVSVRTYALFLCHAHEDVGALLELLGILCGILEQELREEMSPVML